MLKQFYRQKIESESELSLFDKKFTSPSCCWFEKRISPRESVWPTLSLPSLSFLPPLPHNLSGLSSSSGSDPLDVVEDLAALDGDQTDHVRETFKNVLADFVH